MPKKPSKYMDTKPGRKAARLLGEYAVAKNSGEENLPGPDAKAAGRAIVKAMQSGHAAYERDVVRKEKQLRRIAKRLFRKVPNEPTTLTTEKRNAALYKKRFLELAFEELERLHGPKLRKYEHNDLKMAIEMYWPRILLVWNPIESLFKEPFGATTEDRVTPFDHGEKLGRFLLKKWDSTLTLIGEPKNVLQRNSDEPLSDEQYRFSTEYVYERARVYAFSHVVTIEGNGPSPTNDWLRRCLDYEHDLYMKSEQPIAKGVSWLSEYVVFRKPNPWPAVACARNKKLMLNLANRELKVNSRLSTGTLCWVANMFDDANAARQFAEQDSIVSGYTYCVARKL